MYFLFHKGYLISDVVEQGVDIQGKPSVDYEQPLLAHVIQ